MDLNTRTHTHGSSRAVQTHTREAVIKAYLQFRNTVEEEFADFKRAFEYPDSGLTAQIEYVDNGNIVISSNLCPLVIQFEEEDCLKDKSLKCVVKEKHPRPGDEGMMMQLWYPDSFLDNEERRLFILKFFNSTKILNCMQLVDKETSKHCLRNTPSLI